MSKVQLDPNTPDGLTVFQIQNIPDCRYINFSDAAGRVQERRDPHGGRPRHQRSRRPDADYFDTGGNVLNPETLYLNVTPLMPIEVTKVRRCRRQC